MKMPSSASTGLNTLNAIWVCPSTIAVPAVSYSKACEILILSYTDKNVSRLERSAAGEPDAAERAELFRHKMTDILRILREMPKYAMSFESFWHVP